MTMTSHLLTTVYLMLIFWPFCSTQVALAAPALLHSAVEPQLNRNPLIHDFSFLQKEVVNSSAGTGNQSL